MSDYTEHLISMAGGDGELSDALATLEDRVENGTMRPDDRRDLRLILNHISEQQTRLDRATVLIGELADPDYCSFDHHGGCQAHGYLGLAPGETCPQHDAKNWEPTP